MLRHSMTAVAVAVLVCACGGGGGNGALGDGPVPLNSKLDVVRELGNINDFIVIGDGQAPGPAAADVAAKRGMPARPALRRAPMAKASSTESCGDGGSVQIEDGTKQRVFEHFDVTRSVGFERARASNCAEGFGNTTFIGNGVLETGETSAGDYGYFLAGDGREPFRQRIEERSSTGTVEYWSNIAFGGLSEYRYANNSEESRDVIRIDAENSEGFSGTAELGEGRNDPLITIEGNGRYQVNGPYRYRTGACAGGAVRVETLNPITFGSNHYPNGGRLRLSSGTGTATITLNLDNSATVQFGSGATTTITAAEMRDIYDYGGPC